jgi:ubiquinone/menaquinone biosynthesis C-methylase UbiE
MTAESTRIESPICNTGPAAAPTSVSVAEGYDRWAPSYDHVPNPLLNLEERRLTPLLPSLSGKHVLDLACGTGRWLAKLLECGASFGVGADLSAAMLTVAGRKTAITGRLVRADCLHLPFHTSVFDLVICSFALGHIYDLGALVRELARVTKPGADAFISDLHPEAYARGWRTGFRDTHGAVQIDTLSRTTEEIISAFYSGGSECLTQLPLCLGEPEKLDFVRAGKSHLFTTACQVPVVVVCQFRFTPDGTMPQGVK